VRPGTCYTVCTMVRRVLAVVPLLGLAFACASPTLPLPPPEVPTIEMGSDDNHVLLVEPCGGSEPDALINIINFNATGANEVTGLFADGCGSWKAEVWAHVGDVLQIDQQVGEQIGQSIDVQVTAPQ
jgi:hypothetical protein